MKVVLGALLVVAGLGAAVMIRAEETASTAVQGPVVAPLARPADQRVRLEYPASVASVGEPNSSAAPEPADGDLFAKFRGGAAKTEVQPNSETKRPLRLPAVFASKPSKPATEPADDGVNYAIEQGSVADGTGEANHTPSNEQPQFSRDHVEPQTEHVAESDAKPAKRRGIQAAFRQLTAPITNNANRTLPEQNAAPPSPASSQTGPLSTNSSDAPPQDALPSVKIEAMPPWRTVPMQIEPGMQPSHIEMGDGTIVGPDAIGGPGAVGGPGMIAGPGPFVDAGYYGPPRVPKSQCGYCSPAPAFGCCTCQSVRQGGPGCNNGNFGPDGVCTTCGGYDPSGTHRHGHRGDGCNAGGQPSDRINGNGLLITGTPAYGSFFIERLACCLCTPYPDCSNGCVDFCQSWIFHEDCCWLTSNHKCCNPGCPEYPHGGCSQGSSGCGCACAECVPPPDLYFTADAFILTRDNATNNQAVAVNSVTGDPLLMSRDFGYDYVVGPAFTLGYRPTPWDAWEISYFGLLDWDSNQSLAGAGDLSLPGELGTALDLNFDGVDTMDMTYSSVIHNAEVNYYWTSGQVMWMLGFRYFHLGEDFTISSVGPLGESDYDTLTRNNLYGGQIGARYRAGWDRLNWDVFGKAGVFGNDAEQQQYIANIGEAPIRDTLTRGGKWAFVGDVGVNLTWRLGKCWSVRGGYNLLWVDGVALAPDQLDFTDTLTSGTALNSNGSVFYHGAHAGIGCNW